MNCLALASLCSNPLKLSYALLLVHALMYTLITLMHNSLMITPCMQVLPRNLSLQVVFISKFIGHSRELHIIGNFLETQLYSLRCLDYSSNESISNVHQSISIYLQCTHSGEVNLRILELVSSNPKTSIFYRCLFCQQ